MNFNVHGLAYLRHMYGINTRTGKNLSEISSAMLNDVKNNHD